jgi:hypothetical protein
MNRYVYVSHDRNVPVNGHAYSKRHVTDPSHPGADALASLMSFQLRSRKEHRHLRLSPVAKGREASRAAMPLEDADTDSTPHIDSTSENSGGARVGGTVEERKVGAAILPDDPRDLETRPLSF